MQTYILLHVFTTKENHSSMTQHMLYFMYSLLHVTYTWLIIMIYTVNNSSKISFDFAAAGSLVDIFLVKWDHAVDNTLEIRCRFASVLALPLDHVKSRSINIINIVCSCCLFIFHKIYVLWSINDPIKRNAKVLSVDKM